MTADLTTLTDDQLIAEAARRMCPSWCAETHTLEHLVQGCYHHDSEAAAITLFAEDSISRDDTESLFVKVSLYVPAAGESPTCGVQVELQSDSQTLLTLSPVAAGRLAAALLDACSEATAKTPVD